MINLLTIPNFCASTKSATSSKRPLLNSLSPQHTLLHTAKLAKNTANQVNKLVCYIYQIEKLPQGITEYLQREHVQIEGTHQWPEVVADTTPNSTAFQMGLREPFGWSLP